MGPTDPQNAVGTSAPGLLTEVWGDVVVGHLGVSSMRESGGQDHVGTRPRGGFSSPLALFHQVDR